MSTWDSQQEIHSPHSARDVDQLVALTSSKGCSAPLNRDVWRIPKFAILATLLVAGAAAAIYLATVLFERADGMTRYVRVDVWAVRQAEYELAQVRLFLSRHIAGDRAITAKSVRDQIVRAKSAVSLLRQDSNYEDFRLLVDVERPSAIAKSSLREIERLLKNHRDLRGDLGALRQADKLLSLPVRAYEQLAMDLLEVRRELQDKDLENVRWLTNINVWMLLGLVLIVVLFVHLLISEARAARHAERRATANEKRTRHVAEHDLLTDLPNRILFRKLLESAINSAAGDGVVLQFLNLDRFKEFNDAFGQAFGDKLLVTIAAELRKSLAGNGQLFRLGGDEFAVLMQVDAGDSDWQSMAVSLLATCERRMVVDAREVQLSTSIGIALFPDDAETAESLQKCADIALSEAKKQRRCIAKFEPGMMARLESRRQLEDDLHIALTSDQIHVFFQAQVDLNSGRCIGTEALVRWQHPTLGWISPAEFIPIAEESGLILPLGQLVLENACRAALTWPNATDTVVAVNVSPSQFNHQNLVNVVQDVLEKTELPAQRLALEVTEGLLMRDEQAAITTMSSLHSLGVQLAIDDFGTGYSSLSYLKQFKVDKLKIDQSFIRDLASDEDDQKIVQTIVNLGRALEMKVIAEGIEETVQARILRGIGCDEGQGYLFAKPQSNDDFCDWLIKTESINQDPPLHLEGSQTK